MADPITDLTQIGQKAMQIPQEILNVEMRQINEKMGVLTSGLQGMAASVPQLPVLGQGMPQLPGLPQLPGVGGVATGNGGGAAQTRSEAIQGVNRRTKKSSYLEV